MEKYKGKLTDKKGRSGMELQTYDFLDKLGISYKTVCHEAAFTMEQC